MTKLGDIPNPLRASSEADAGTSGIHLAVLTLDAQIRAAAERAGSGGRVALADSPAELVAQVRRAPPGVIVVDGAADVSGELIAQLAGSPERAGALLVLVDRGAGARPGLVDLLVTPPALPGALDACVRAARGEAEPPAATDRLLDCSLVGGDVEPALAAAADELAAAFGAERCLIAPRGDSAGITGERTWTSIEWMEAAARCRVASASGATLVAPLLSVGDGRGVASYLAVRMDAQPDSGFIGLIAERARVFTAAERAALERVARRFHRELSWRNVHERMIEEFEQVASGPGIDSVLGTWNRAALEQLAGMELAFANRSRVPLAVAVFDVVNLQSVNTAHGLQAGDALLRRLADAIRAQVRDEDLVGRWSGDEIAVLFRGAGPDTARPIAHRLITALRSRPLELARGCSIPLDTTVGIAAAVEGESAEQLLGRAARAARKAQDSGDVIAGAARTPTPARISQQLDAGREIGSTTLGGAYRLLHEISRGGMGVVYRGEDLALERPVAIKMLRPDLGENRDFTERFRREAAMLAHLRHPNLVQVYSFGVSGEDSYFVMELVEGESLEQSIERGRLEGTALSLGEVSTVVEQIAGALDALHERGIIHRDVKPANVILDPFRGRAVLVDVGIAHQYDQPGVIAGTPGYVAPEVIAGGEAGPRADVYGLAATVYATLTLSAPWPGSDALEVIENQRRGPPRPPSSIRPELAPLDKVLLGALSKDPRERPDSAGALARAIAARLAEVVGQRRATETRAREATGKNPVQRRAAPGPAEPRTRGVVFRSVARVLGVREAERLRDAIGGEHPDLARALSQDTAPLGWLPADLFRSLLRVAPARVSRDPARFAGDVARAAVRASFRRFFPASSATLVPENTLSAIRSVWARYQAWGTISSMPVHSTTMVVRLTDKPPDALVCAWTGGLLEQLVVLAGGRHTQVEHHECDARGDRACLFRVTWRRPT